MLKYTLDTSEFSNLFDQYNRGDNFSIAARKALFDYYEDLSGDIGESIDIDVIAICCEWAEYTLDELVQEYGYMVDDLEHFGEIVELLEQNTTVLEVEHYGKESTYLVQAF